MGERFDPSPIELAEHERAALELTRLRRKGIRCHLENHSDGGHCHVDVVRDLEGELKHRRIAGAFWVTGKSKGGL
jgi:hypothetical protein